MNRSIFEYVVTLMYANYYDSIFTTIPQSERKRMENIRRNFRYISHDI